MEGVGLKFVLSIWLTSHIGENESKRVTSSYKCKHILVVLYKCASLDFQYSNFCPTSRQKCKNASQLPIISRGMY